MALTILDTSERPHETYGCPQAADELRVFAEMVAGRIDFGEARRRLDV